MFRNLYLGFLGGSDNEESACNGDDLGSIPGQEYLLEYGMATHFSIFNWKIPWTEEPGRLHSRGLQSMARSEFGSGDLGSFP